MASYSGSGSGSGFYGYMHARVEVTRTDYDTYSAFTVTCKVVSDSGSSSFISGRATSSSSGGWGSYSYEQSVSAYGTTTLKTQTFNYSRGTSQQYLTCRAAILGGGTGMYNGSYDEASVSVPIPAISYDKPNAPSGCTATYVSDSQATVAWANGSTTTTKPRTATIIERQADGGSWAQVASVGGSATSYTDNGISANTQYQYRVRAKNAAGYSAYSTSGSIYTTPAAPASVTLDKTAATTVQVDVTGTWGYAVTYDIESTYDGGSTWASVATSTSLPYSATVNAGTVQFRVRAVRGSLSSAWALSASLVTICPPLAPTIVQAPANPTAYGDSSVISWTPNHPDGSTQSAAQVKVTNPGGTSTTYSVTTATSYTFTPNATGTWTAQVRTKGLDPSYGEWSQTVSWGVHNPPAVVITSPATDGTDVVALPLNVAWTVTDPTGVSTQRIIIEGDGQILNRTLAGDVRTVALNASDVALENGQTYTIRLRVMGGSGLVTEQTRIFDVAWLAPAAPVLQLTEGEGRSATIGVMDTRYTSSGTVLEASSAMMDSLTIHGLSVQDGTPTPSAPVPIRSVQSGNLSPFFSHDFTDVYNASTNPNGYWRTLSTSNYTQLSDGWAHFEKSNITATTNYYFALNNTHPAWLKPNTTYTVYIHVKNAVSTGGTYVSIYASTGTNAAVPSVGTGGFVSESDHIFVKQVTTGADVTSQINILNGCVQMRGTAESPQSFTVDLRISIYEGAYRGAYTPVGNIVLESVGKNVVNCPDLSGTLSNAYLREFSVDAGNLAPFELVAGQTYTLSANVVSSVQQFRASVGCGNGSYALDIASKNNLTDGRMSITFTPTAAQLASGNLFAFRAPRYSAQTTFTFTVSDVQLEIGSTATAYEPYSSTTAPIPVTLRSLPYGTYDEWISGESADTLVQRVGETMQAVTDGVTGTVGVDVLSSTGEIANGAQVLYKLATPVTTTLTHVNLPYVDGSAWVDAEVTPSIEATFRPVDFPDQPTIQSVDVQRVNADGTAWTVATGLTVGGSCIDPLPPLGVPVTYRATSSAASGSTASGEFTETFGGRDWALNFGNAAQEHVEFIYNPQADLSLAQGGKGYHFADGGAGNGLPVFYPTTDRDYAGTLKFDTILYGDSDKVLDLCDRYPVAWLRDPFGHRWRAHVAPSVSHGVGQVWPVTLSWDAMRFEEAWDG